MPVTLPDHSFARTRVSARRCQVEVGQGRVVGLNYRRWRQPSEHMTYRRGGVHLGDVDDVGGFLPSLVTVAVTFRYCGEVEVGDASASGSHR